MGFLQLTLSGPVARLQSEKVKFGSAARVLRWLGWLALGVGLAAPTSPATVAPEPLSQISPSRFAA